jgi:hypothetical protein
MATSEDRSNLSLPVDLSDLLLPVDLSNLSLLVDSSDLSLPRGSQRFITALWISAIYHYPVDLAIYRSCGFKRFIASCGFSSGSCYRLPEGAEK